MPSTLTIRLIALAVIVSVLGGLVYAWNNKEKLLCDLKTEVVVNKIESGSLKDTIKKDGIAKVIESDVRSDLSNKTITLSDKQDSLKDNVSKKEKDVINKYTDLKIKKIKENIQPKMVEDTSEKDTELSTIRINGLWDQYCTDSQEHEKCKPISQEIKQ